MQPHGSKNSPQSSGLLNSSYATDLKFSRAHHIWEISDMTRLHEARSQNQVGIKIVTESQNSLGQKDFPDHLVPNPLSWLGMPSSGPRCSKFHPTCP